MPVQYLARGDRVVFDTINCGSFYIRGRVDRVAIIDVLERIYNGRIFLDPIAVHLDAVAETDAAVGTGYCADGQCQMVDTVFAIYGRVVVIVMRGRSHVPAAPVDTVDAAPLEGFAFAHCHRLVETVTLLVRSNFGKRQTVDIVATGCFVGYCLRVDAGFRITLVDDDCTFIVLYCPLIRFRSGEGCFVIVYHRRLTVDEYVINRVASLMIEEARIFCEGLVADHYFFAGTDGVMKIFLNLLQYCQIQDIAGRIAVRTHLNPGMSAV